MSLLLNIKPKKKTPPVDGFYWWRPTSKDAWRIVRKSGPWIYVQDCYSKKESTGEFYPHRILSPSEMGAASNILDNPAQSYPAPPAEPTP